MIKVKEATVRFTEQTLRELVVAVDEARKRIPDFTDDPMPEGDMEECQRGWERAKRGVITVVSPYAVIAFEIELEKKPNTQEAMGYRLSRETG